MHFLRHYRFALSFLALLVFCSVMVIQQFKSNYSRHAEMREAFILLFTKGYAVEAQRLYERLLDDTSTLANKELLDDFQRTLMIVDPTAQQPRNLIWKYHWTVSNELERRSESTVARALKLAHEKK